MNIEFDVRFGTDSARREAGAARNVLLIGDFSGAAGAGDGAIRHMFNVDPVEIDAAVARIGPRVSVAVGDASLDVDLESLDDFHPDALLKSIPAFSAAMELRRALGDSSKAAEAAVLTRQLLGVDSVPDTTAAQAAAPEQEETSDDLFSRLLGRDVSTPDTPSPAVRSTLDLLLKEAVDEDTTPAPDAGAIELREQLEVWISTAVRELLRSPEFRGPETAWRSLAWLMENVEVDETVEIWIVDVGSARVVEWAAELPRRVAAGPGGADSLIVLPTFSDDADSLSDLEALATVASEANARAFAGASESLAGLTGELGTPLALDGSDFGGSAPDGWDDRRGALGSVCLGFPALLLRQPFGDKTDPVDAMDFDELGSAPAHDAFLWGSAGTALAAMSLKDSLLVEDSLLVTYDDGTGQAIKPASGAWLTDSAVDALLARGIVPLLAERGSTRLLAPRLQSLAIRAL